jgi:hypothetical protein
VTRQKNRLEKPKHWKIRSFEAFRARREWMWIALSFLKRLRYSSEIRSCWSCFNDGFWPGSQRTSFSSSRFWVPHAQFAPAQLLRSRRRGRRHHRVLCKLITELTNKRMKNCAPMVLVVAHQIGRTSSMSWTSAKRLAKLILVFDVGAWAFWSLKWSLIR